MRNRRVCEGIAFGVLVSVLGCQNHASTPTTPPSPGEQAAAPQLSATQASQFVGLSLGCIDRAYPNKPGAIYDGDETVRPPREQTPVFFGCFDWHSAVHGHWALVRMLRLFPALPEAATIRARLDAHLVPAALERERAHFALERNRSFERPYGWAWYLRLAAELASFRDADAARWFQAVQPLADDLAARTIDYLAHLDTPIRSGVHQNTAFAMLHTLAYARATKNEALIASLTERARHFYGRDVACPTSYEPSGEDFISPCLTEAELLRELLPAPEFAAVFEKLLPTTAAAAWAPVLTPPTVLDPKDPTIGHLIGLCFERAWVLRGLALVAPPALAAQFKAAITAHERQALTLMNASGYGGEHWLASFAVLDLTATAAD